VPYTAADTKPSSSAFVKKEETEVLPAKVMAAAAEMLKPFLLRFDNIEENQTNMSGMNEKIFELQQKTMEFRCTSSGNVAASKVKSSDAVGPVKHRLEDYDRTANKKRKEGHTSGTEIHNEGHASGKGIRKMLTNPKVDRTKKVEVEKAYMELCLPFKHFSEDIKMSLHTLDKETENGELVYFV
jgi:hypothetical protein